MNDDLKNKNKKTAFGKLNLMRNDSILSKDKMSI